MGKIKILSETPMSLVEVREEVKRIKKRDTEPSFRVTKVDEYLNGFTGLGIKEEKELVEKISGLNIPRLRDEHIKKLVDLMPTTLDQLKVIMQGYVVTINQDNMKKLVSVFKEYIPDKKPE
jgi:DNA-directed RNA polymerase subunit F